MAAVVLLVAVRLPATKILPTLGVEYIRIKLAV